MQEFLSQSNPGAIEYPPISGIYNVFFTADIFLKKCKIETPSIQRELDPESVNQLENDIKSKAEVNGYYDFGIFEMAELQGILNLCNGQHRYQVLKNIVEKCNPGVISVQVRIKGVHNESELNEYWKICNASQPQAIFQNSDQQIMINQLKKHLLGKYPKFISKGKNPHKPNLNLEHLINHLQDNLILNQLQLTHKTHLIELVEELNNYYQKNRYNEEKWTQWKIRAEAKRWKTKTEKKETTHLLFLGIWPDYEWIDRLIINRKQGLSYEEMNHYWKNVSNKKRIRPRLRQEVWNKHNSGCPIEAGHCFVCGEILSFRNMQCGHIKAHYFGGSTTVDNLEPICGSCNQEMGVEDLMVFKKRNYPSNLKN